MAETAGFAVVGCVKQGLINQALRVATANLTPLYSFQLPNVVTVGNTSVEVRGSLLLMPPQVTLQTRADDLVSVSVGFAGEVLLKAPNTSKYQFTYTQVLLSANVLVGLVTQVTTNGNVQQITVGLNLAAASVTAVGVTVLAGPPLISLFNDVLTSPAVLSALTSALRALPANLTQVTPQGINLPLQIIQTYQPPNGSIFFPNTLFQLQFAVSRILARPLNANKPGPGVLVVAVDMSQPVATTGDPNALVDITGPVGDSPGIDLEDAGIAQFSPGDPSPPPDGSAGIALLIDSGWVVSVFNGVLSPQLAGKFTEQLAKNNVSFSNSPDCVQVSFGQITAPLDSPLSPPIPSNVQFEGIILQVKVTRWAQVSRDNLGYYHGDSSIGTVDAVFNANSAIIGWTNGRSQQPTPTPPNLTNDQYGVYAIGTDISLPWWVDIVAFFGGGLAYFLASDIAGLFGVDIFYPTIIANANNTAGRGLQAQLGGLFSNQFMMMVAQLPGLPAPNWVLTIAGFGVSSDTGYCFVDLFPLTVDLDPSNIGSFPYLVLTDQSVTDPNSVPNAPGSPAFLQRFEGSFNWAGIAYNQPGDGVLGGTFTWRDLVNYFNPIGVVLKIPPGLFNPQDPTIFVQWTATRTDTGAVLVSKTLGLNQPGALAISIDHGSAALQACDEFQITCTMFQVLAEGSTTQIFNSGNVFVEISDIYDRHHPYASWEGFNKIIHPGMPYWIHGSKSHTRWTKNVRPSRIHRTDNWGKGGQRCVVASSPGTMGNPPRKHPPPRQPQFPGKDFICHDQLPIPVAELQADRNKARGVLCDYCFFGGPTKTALRTDFPTAPNGGLPQ